MLANQRACFVTLSFEALESRPTLAHAFGRHVDKTLNSLRLVSRVRGIGFAPNLNVAGPSDSIRPCLSELLVLFDKADRGYEDTESQNTYMEGNCSFHCYTLVWLIKESFS